VQVVGNAIFNWGDQVPMSSGILEASSCGTNLLSHNNINYCKGPIVASHGADSIAEHNIGQPDNAYIGMTDTPVPDFKTERIDRFIQQ
jgi:hypothetical protein